MTEPLGRSQVLEYLVELNKTNKIFLISFERKEDLENIEEIKELTKQNNIEWQYFIYSNKYGIFSTIAQLFNAVKLGRKTIKEKSIDIVHARSMIPATMGYILKKLTNTKLLFDIRGFAIDEKLDSGRLKRNSILYKTLKKWDDFLYKRSDYIVTLTHKAKDILGENLSINKNKITVIPTCANDEVFKTIDSIEKEAFKKSLGYKSDDIIFIHTGTVGGWYDFDKELLLLKELIKSNNKINFLILNKKERTFIDKKLEEFSFPMNKVQITSSRFEEVHKFLNISDYSIFFIKPSFSKQASAPTKFAENVICNLPSITNTNVGDMEYYLTNNQVGILVDLDNFDIPKIVNKINDDLNNNYTRADFEKLFYEHFDKNMAIQKYQKIYENI